MKSLTIFDIDDTLFRTSSKVSVMIGDKVVSSLSPAEFNVYTPRPGERFSFSQFISASHFYKTAKPVDHMFRVAKKMIKRIDGEFIIITARPDMDDRDLFLKTFKKYGFPVERTHIHRAGNSGAGAPAKKSIIRRELEKSDYGIVRMFDDHKPNLQAFQSLQPDFPNTKFDAFLVKVTGEISRI